MMSYQNCIVVVALAAAMSLAGCADNNAKKAPVLKCTDYGVGLSTPPTVITQAAMAAHAEAEKLSVPTLIENASKGDAAAQVELGLRYVNGTGVEKDGEKAAALFKAAADQENPMGQFFLGSAYSQGIGLPQSDVPAIELWEKASRNGYANAQFWLGMMISNGFGGIAADWCAALPMFLAASDEVTDAAFMVGLGYHEGKFSDPSYAEAAKYYRQADAISRKQSGIYNQKARFNLRLMIDAGQVQWQPGDPGKAPVPGEASEKQMKLHISDPAVETTG